LFAPWKPRCAGFALLFLFLVARRFVAPRAGVPNPASKGLSHGWAWFLFLCRGVSKRSVAASGFAARCVRCGAGKHPANIHHSVEAFQLLVVLVFLLLASAAISRFTTSNSALVTAICFWRIYHSCCVSFAGALAMPAL